MKNDTLTFDEHAALHKLRHFLPTQSPLKDFIHHNTLHAYQDHEFHQGLHLASVIFGYKTYLPLYRYRSMLRNGSISERSIREAIIRRHGAADVGFWRQKMIYEPIDESLEPRIGQFRNQWLKHYKFNPGKDVHPNLFRLVGSFLDQGIATKPFPVKHKGFMASVRELSTNSHASLFKSKRVIEILHHPHTRMSTLLNILVGDPDLYETYLFDQQFAHPGWSGMVSVLEENPGLCSTTVK